ncbi:hypothetical protein [Polynucleobacter meluiroseus]|nr:hypothetical protein [Polynucleobacter meluiroseus]
MENTRFKKELPSYLRFIQLVESIGLMKLSPELDDLEAHLLDRIAINALSGTHVQIGEMLALSQLGSQATIHNRIKRLTANGYLSVRIDQADARRKYLIPTSLAKKRFDVLSKALNKAVLGA